MNAFCGRKRLRSDFWRAAVLCALLPSMAGACAVSEEGTTVELNISTDGRPQFGDALSLVVVVSEVELLPCQPGIAERLQQFLIPQAFAHTSSSPTLLGTPHVLDVRALQSVVIGTLEPPPGEYCGLRVFISAADDDAVGLDLHPWMLNRSVALVRGNDVLVGTTAAYEFRAEFPRTIVEPGSPRRLTVRIQPDSLTAPPEPQGDGPLRDWLLALPQLTSVQVDDP
jgi:hypothetical protein